MTVGEYIRTDDGLIGKVVSEQYEYKDSIGCDIDFGNNDIYNEYEMHQSIIKSSPNIIDLLQVEDYVNGHKISLIYNNVFYTDEYTFDNIDGEFIRISFKYDEIKSIVTKEQFLQMEYRIGK